MSCSPKTKSALGFTLVEILVVLAILGLVYGLALPVFSRTLDGPRLERAVRALVADLREARSLALARGEPVFVYIQPQIGAWRLENSSDGVDHSIQIRASVPNAWRSADGTHVIGFFPDGESSGGEIRLRLNDRAQQVKVQWLTGRVVRSEN